MARKKKEENLVQLPPDSPPPPLFLGEKERNLVKQVNDELIERVIGQTLIYYPLSRETTQYHSVYGEAIRKTFMSPVKVNALIKWEGNKTTADSFGIDRLSSIVVEFHKRRLSEDQDLYVREGDFVYYGSIFYEIVSLNEPRAIFGQIEHKMEIEAKCIRTRESVFNAK
jgi:hypothetical protein